MFHGYFCNRSIGLFRIQHIATLIQFSSCLFSNDPIAICANFKLQLSTDHTSLHVTSWSVPEVFIIILSKFTKMYALSKLNKWNEQTWVNLQKRLNEVQFPYATLFASSEVQNFVKNKSLSVSSCKGYFIPSIWTTTAYILVSNQAKVNTLTHSQPLNVYTIFVGYPGKGKFFEFSFVLSGSNHFMW